MGLKFIKTTDKDCLLGLWEINEEYDRLLAEVSLDPEEKKRLDSFRYLPRKLEYLSVRALLQTMLNPQARIVYDSTNKPYLKDNSYGISISHSGKYTAIFLSHSRRVGVDMEYMSHRISNLAHRFVNPVEKIVEDTEKQRYHLYIHWCAKEALYKITDKNRLNFKKHLIIKPFEPQDEGIIHGVVNNEYINEEFDLMYVRMDNYIIVWCCK